MKKIEKLGIKATDDYTVHEWTIDRFLDVAEKINEIIDILNKEIVVLDMEEFNRTHDEVQIMHAKSKKTILSK